MSRPEARQEARRWLAQAQNDLAFTEHAMRGGFHAQACFHAQQVAEKAVKAVHHPNGLPGNLPFEVYSAVQASDALAAARRIVDFARDQVERAS